VDPLRCGLVAPPETKHATASQASREQTEALVLRVLHRHGIANARGFRDSSFDGVPLAAIAEATHLSRPSVYAVRDMYTVAGDSPVLTSDVRGEDGRFRGPLRLRSDLGYAVGVDFGPRHARVAIADVHGQLYGGHGVATHFPLGQPPEMYLDWAASNIHELMQAAGVERNEVIGVGISQVAPINVRTGYPHPNGLTNKAWRDVGVARQLARRLGWDDIDWVSDNDTNLRMLAEHECGAARGLDVVAYVNWSNHIGFGLIVGGSVYRGSRGYAGELGHRLISDGVGSCPRCGRKGCLEFVISASGIAAAHGAPEDALPMAEDFVFRRMAEERAAGKNAVFEQVNEATQYLADTVALIVDTLDPDAVVLAGSLGARIHDNTALLATFRSTLESRHMGFADNIGILEPKLGIESAVRGAVLQVLSERLVQWARGRFATATPAVANATAKPTRDARRRVTRRSVSHTKEE
jgi:predicted NBD/HSP70 family sugar kinase